MQMHIIILPHVHMQTHQKQHINRNSNLWINTHLSSKHVHKRTNTQTQSSSKPMFDDEINSSPATSALFRLKRLRKSPRKVERVEAEIDEVRLCLIAGKW